MDKINRRSAVISYDECDHMLLMANCTYNCHGLHRFNAGSLRICEISHK